jgi:hypothetical protein
MGKRCTMYYGWEPLRDIQRVGSLVAAEFIQAYSFEHTDGILTDRALDYIKLAKPDFVFLYMVCLIGYPFGLPFLFNLPKFVVFHRVFNILNFATKVQFSRRITKYYSLFIHFGSICAEISFFIKAIV